MIISSIIIIMTSVTIMMITSAEIEERGDPDQPLKLVRVERRCVEEVGDFLIIIIMIMIMFMILEVVVV